MVLFIGPPFGNYLIFPNTISIKGSFTLHERTGLFSQILKTLRFSPEYGGWINKIGLRNPGIDYAIKDWANVKINNALKDIRYRNNKKKILHQNVVYSIAILDKKDIPILLEKLPRDMNLELNVSCPNLKKNMIITGIEQFINPNREWCIVKLSPKTETEMIDKFYEKGFRQFHCSNTLPVIGGGLSGPRLIPHTSRLVEYIKTKYPDTEVIAGGGIQKYDTLLNYQKLGANHFAVSTIFFHPILCSKFFYNFYKRN